MTTPLPRCAMMSSLDCRRHATIASYGVGMQRGAVGMQRAAVGLGTRPRPWAKFNDHALPIRASCAYPHGLPGMRIRGEDSKGAWMLRWRREGGVAAWRTASSR